MFLVTSPVVIIVPTRVLLAVETMHAVVQIGKFESQRNMTSMFVGVEGGNKTPARKGCENEKHPLISCTLLISQK